MCKCVLYVSIYYMWVGIICEWVLYVSVYYMWVWYLLMFMESEILCNKWADNYYKCKLHVLIKFMYFIHKILCCIFYL